MIRLAVQDRERPVELFGEDEACHDVREGQLRQGNLSVLAGIDSFRESIRAADYEDQSLQSVVGLLLDELRELLGGKLLAAFV